MRLRRRRPPLLPQELALRRPTTTRRSTCSRAIRPSAGSTRCHSCATATPTTTSSAPRGSRPSCGRPVRRCRPRSCSRTASKLVKIFTHYTSSDINSAEQMLQVLRLFFDLRGAQIKEIHFNGTLGPSYVTATPDEIHTAVNQFLGIESTPGPRGSSAKPSKAVAARSRRRMRRSRSRPQEAQSGSCRIDHPHPPSYGKQLAVRNQAAQGEGPGLLPDAPRDRERLCAEATRLQDQRQGRPVAATRRASGLQVGLLAADDRRLLRVRGDPLEGPADPRQPER